MCDCRRRRARAAASLGVLLHAGHTQMPLFLLCTTLLLPLFQAWTFPLMWPPVVALLAGLSAIWLWEGVRPLFTGLVLFQARAARRAAPAPYPRRAAP